jgi:hypothetical protein
LIFLEKNFTCFRALTVKMASFLVQTIKFEFKWDTWINQEVTHRYQSPAPGTGGIARAGSNAGGIARPRRPLPVQAIPGATSYALELA